MENDKKDNKRILIIDDDKSIWDAYRAILSVHLKQSAIANSITKIKGGRGGENINQPEEFELFFSSQGQEGFVHAKAMQQQDRPFAVAFIDLRMPPGWDGVKTAAEIRKIDPDVEIVIVTAYGDYSLEDIVRQIGRPDKLLFLKKPFDIEEVSQLALSLTEKWNMARKEERQKKNLEKAYAELKTAQDHLIQKEKMASIGLLAAGVAHEINNPVGFVASNLNTLSKYIDKIEHFITFQTEIVTAAADNESYEALNKERNQQKIDFILADIKELLGESKDGTEQIKMIVQGLKNFSRDDGSKYSLANINECLENTIKVVWNELKYKATVIKDLADLPLTLCYPQQLNQVFMNLLVNGAHAIKKMGEITVKTWQEDDTICVKISDTGSGIKAEHLQHIFDPFFTTKETGKGTGLGLSIVHDIVTKNHHGSINVESEVGHGTSFTVRIPYKN